MNRTHLSRLQAGAAQGSVKKAEQQPLLTTEEFNELASQEMNDALYDLYAPSSTQEEDERTAINLSLAIEARTKFIHKQQKKLQEQHNVLDDLSQEACLQNVEEENEDVNDQQNESAKMNWTWVDSPLDWTNEELDDYEDLDNEEPLNATNESQRSLKLKHDLAHLISDENVKSVVAVPQKAPERIRFQKKKRYVSGVQERPIQKKTHHSSSSSKHLVKKNVKALKSQKVKRTTHTRRKRHVYTKEELELLMDELEYLKPGEKMPSKKKREKLGDQIGVDEPQIYGWYYRWNKQKGIK